LVPLFRSIDVVLNGHKPCRVNDRLVDMPVRKINQRVRNAPTTRAKLFLTSYSSCVAGEFFAHLIQGEDTLDLISFLLKHILVVSPEWNECSSEETFLFPDRRHF
jgi:hypothetical protein